MRLRVTVLGGGSWGTTVAHLVAHNAPALLWARDAEVAREVTEEHRNSRYLAGFDLHPELRATADLAAAVAAADVLVMGVPSHTFRSILTQAAEHLRAWVPVISLTKGLEQGTHLRMTEVIGDVLPGHPCGLLTGPNIAKEIIAGDAAASVLTTTDQEISGQLRGLFASRLFRVYENDDVIGCEVAGALKNVMAIASGMADGLGTGDNTRAAVITRGLHELSVLGSAMGGRPLTFSGLAGMGDLVVTCISPQSRNRHVGVELGKGRPIGEIMDEMRMVAEGVKTAKVVMELAREYDVEMPIAEQVYLVCHEGHTALDAYAGLLRRDHRYEMHGLETRPR